MRYLDPRNDIAFRKIFGMHKDLCISLLNALLPLPENAQIESIEYLTETQFPLTFEQKNSVVDVKCYDNLKRTFFVEMQMYWYENFMPRTLFNLCKAFVSQSRPSMDYGCLQPVYALCLLNDRFLKGERYADTYRSVYTISNEEYPDLKIEGLTFVFVELPKFKSDNKVHNKMAKLWLKFLTEVNGKTSRSEIDDDLKENKYTNQALNILEESSFTKRELAEYDDYWDTISWEITKVNEAKKTGLEEGLEEGMAQGLQLGHARGLEEGRASGLEEGHARGLEEGHARGLEEGIAQGEIDKAKEIARELMALGTMSHDKIAQITSLPLDIIDQLQTSQ